MRDPYSVLGVSPAATGEEVKKAYRDLARKYHPDNYQNNPLADLAEEKMKEINEAYDTITRQRAGGGDQGGGRQSAYNPSYGAQSRSSNPTYVRVRNLINIGDLGAADRLLLEVQQRDGEWYFLTGSVAYRRGWMDEALQNFARAVQMEPNNMEYRQALGAMQQGMGFRSGGYGPAAQCDPCSAYLCFSCLTPWGGPCC